MALTHPADVFLQASYITVAPSEIVIELDMAVGVLVAPQMLPLIDSDNDQYISEVENQSYAKTVVQQLELQVDRQPLELVLTQVDMPDYLTLQSGIGVIRIFALTRLEDGMRGNHQLYYRNNYSPAGSIYVVNAFVDKGVDITLGEQNRDSIQQSMTMEYSIEKADSTTLTPVAASTLPTETADSNTDSVSSADSSGQTQQLLTYLSATERSPWTVLLAIGLATILGSLHALTPGHGKTLVAAYLVGSRGTVKHAVWLGAIVTLTHTSSVIAIGLLALFASQFIVPSLLTPILEILSGLLVVILGLRLTWQRWLAFRNSKKSNLRYTIAPGRRYDFVRVHDHTHDVGHVHDHGDGRMHSHLPPTEGIRFSNLLALGVSGGLLPCPEALGIMVIAVGLNRVLLGMGMILAFSFGLAAVLIVIGILLVRSRSLLERIGGMGGRWSVALPLVSALIVTALGAAIAVKGLAAYLA